MYLAYIPAEGEEPEPQPASQEVGSTVCCNISLTATLNLSVMFKCVLDQIVSMLCCILGLSSCCIFSTTIVMVMGLLAVAGGMGDGQPGGCREHG